MNFFEWNKEYRARQQAKIDAAKAKRHPLQDIEVRTYKSTADYEQDSRRMAGLGYIWDAPVSQQPRAGIGRVAVLGFGAAVFKPKPVLIVTYRKVGQ